MIQLEEVTSLLITWTHPEKFCCQKEEKRSWFIIKERRDPIEKKIRNTGLIESSQRDTVKMKFKNKKGHHFNHA